MGMKCPGNAYRPCRTCKIVGTRKESERGIYFVPHSDYNFQDPPVRTGLRERIDLVERASTRLDGTASTTDAYRKKHGITRKSILLELESIHFPRSFPVDIMHCVLLNITRMMFKLWIRKHLPIDDQKRRGNYVDTSGRAPYYLRSDKLDEIGSALATARPDIPAHLGHAPRRIDNHYKGFKASEWKGWLLYFGVPLLDQSFTEGGDSGRAKSERAEYVANFRQLGQLYSLATQRSLNESDIPCVAQLANEFVQTFEKLYYRGEPDRLQVCTINLHSLLHFPLYIRDCGPACYWWQFNMERFCGILKPKARSKSQMSASLANAVVINEHLNHVRFVLSSGDEEAMPPIDIRLPRLLDEFKPRLSTYQRNHLSYVLDRRVDEVVGFKRCHLRDKLTIGSAESQRRNDVNRASHRICYRQPNKEVRRFGEVQFFIELYKLGRWAWVRTLDKIDIDKKVGVASYDGYGPHRWIQIDWIESLIGVVRQGNVGLIVSDINLFE
jgi:hypothetical protein